MSKQIEALKLALDWFEWFHIGSSIDAKASSTQVRDAIRDALASEANEQPAQQQEPVAVYVGETWCGSVVRLYEDLPLETPLYTSPQPAQHSASVLEQNTSNSLETTNQEAQDEPVAWMEMVVGNLVREGVNKHKARELAQHFYKSLPASKPLTDEQVWNDDELMKLNAVMMLPMEYFMQVVRAIEAAHGITGEQK